jgi:glycosyltransferase involved in cell wall biosynthesis
VSGAEVPPNDNAPVVVFLINDLRMGGAERSLVNLANHARRLRPALVLLDPAAELLHELHPAMPMYSLSDTRLAPRDASELLDLAHASRRRPRGQPRGRLLLELPSLLRKTRRLARVAAATRAQVVSTFLNRSHTIALLAKLLFARRLRIVINVHEMLSDHLDRHFSAAERPLMALFIRRAFPRAAKIIAVSDAVRADLTARFGIPAQRIAIVPNPIDVDRIRRLAGQEAADVPDERDGSPIVAVGRLVHLKGFDLLLHAMARLPATVAPSLHLVGDGPERGPLERLAHELRIADRVHFLGQRDNPWTHVARASVLVVPSRSEASPNVIGEALALSVPVIAARCSDGVIDYLENGRCGVLVPPNDPVSLASAIARVLSDPAERARLVRATQSRQNDIGFEAAILRYEEILLDVANT